MPCNAQLCCIHLQLTPWGAALFGVCCLLPVAVVCAVAELLHLTSLQLLHGELQQGLDISHWSSLRSLAELKLLPGEEGGLRNQQVGRGCSTTI
jgi:hypothetical protein